MFRFSNGRSEFSHVSLHEHKSVQHSSTFRHEQCFDLQELLQPQLVNSTTESGAMESSEVIGSNASFINVHPDSSGLGIFCIKICLCSRIYEACHVLFTA